MAPGVCYRPLARLAFSRLLDKRMAQVLDRTVEGACADEVNAGCDTEVSW